MDKTFNHKLIEPEITKKWEESGAFKAIRDPKKKPYTIVLPPPNASGKMHVGNALMVAIEDLLIRWKRMKGYAALWLPGTDHAGFESQTTYERELKKQNKSRFQYDRKTFYDMMMDFVTGNKHAIEDQLKNMGASLDWSRYTFMLDDRSINTVLDTFKKMEADGKVYRAGYIVNYSFKYGTTFSDAEITLKEQKDPLYYLKYGPFTLATVRPETKFGDTAVAVHPDDARYKEWVGKEIEVEGLNGPFKVKVIADTYVDPEFGTGVVKITPAHDKNDYEVGLRHNLEVKSVIGIDGRMTSICGKYAGMKVLEARKVVVEDLKARGLLVKVDEDYTHLVPVDYRTEDYVEQLVLPNWFVKTGPLRDAVMEKYRAGEVKIYPQWQEVTFERWMENMHDWAISRQIVWGIRIPAWYSVTENPDMTVTFLHADGSTKTGKVGELLRDYSFEEIEAGLQSLMAPINAKYVVAKEKPTDLEGNFLQETDVFDTWFSSGQWPLTTTGYPDSDDFKYFYPTAVLETGWEIITRWVSRMLMFGVYLTGEVPFKDVYLHGRVMAVDGKKMSKSLGNVINPEEYQAQYGTDALRMGLISGTANGKDFAFPKDKVTAYRNFGNKIWNMARFMELLFDDVAKAGGAVKEFAEEMSGLQGIDKEMLAGFNTLVKTVDESLEKYRFSDAADAIYHYMWDDLASRYIEDVKSREDKEVALSVLQHIFVNCLKVLHPFMPFVTEAIWGELRQTKGDTTANLLAGEAWPKTTA